MDWLIKISDWLIKNSEWAFSGIGVAIIGCFLNRKLNTSVKQSAKNSTNVTQVGGNIKLGNSDDRPER